jgi:hypothetical protein
VFVPRFGSSVEVKYTASKARRNATVLVRSARFFNAEG